MGVHRRPHGLRFSHALAAALVALVALALPTMAQSQPAGPNADTLRALLADPTVTGADSSVHYVGTASDPAVYVAVVDSGAGTVEVYLCDGDVIAEWFEGTVADGAFEATSAAGGTISGSLDGVTATGSATLGDGTALDFSVALAELPAGLYQRTAAGSDGNIILSRTIQLPDGTAKGKAKPAPPVTAAASCAHLEITFDLFMDVYQTTNNATTRSNAGNKATKAFQDAKGLGCGWVNAYL